MNPDRSSSAAKRDGWLSGFSIGLYFLFLAQVVVGGLLEFSYSPTVQGAYESVRKIQAGGSAMFRGFHYWSSALLIVGSIALLVWLVVSRRASEKRLWFAAVLLFLSCLVGQITGNLLPFDRHAVQTAVIEGGVARQMPVVGELSARMVLGGEQFTPRTLELWHIAHIGSMALGIVGAVLIWGWARRQRPASGFLWAPAGMGALLALMAPAPLGAPASGSDFNSYDASVSWYTWPLHGSLNLFSKLSPDLGWIGSGLMPALLIGLLLLAPYISQRLSPKFVQIAMAVMGAYFLAAAIFFGGAFAPLTGNRDPQSPTAKLAPISKADPALVARGRELFNSSGCAGCHGKDGSRSLGGPVLTGIGARRGGDASWYMRFIRNPSSVKPNSPMPGFPKLTEEELRAMAEFLMHLK